MVATAVRVSDRFPSGSGAPKPTTMTTRRLRSTPFLRSSLLSFLLLLLLASGGASGRRLGDKDDPPPSSDAVVSSPRSTTFPPHGDAVEFARLSHVVYKYKHAYYLDGDTPPGEVNCRGTHADGSPIIPSDVRCEHYEHDGQGTRVMVVTSSRMKYVAVAFTGTDDARSALTDGRVLTKPFGNLSNATGFVDLFAAENCTANVPANEGEAMKVHSGFDDAVFADGLFVRLLRVVRDLKVLHPSYRIVTTGHSLGAAAAVLTAVGLKRCLPPEEPVVSVNFGCPRVGNRAFKEYANSIGNLGLWRLVHGYDVVPRLPSEHMEGFAHVGHTMQMDDDAMRIYYRHDGDEGLGYAGVPRGWSAYSFLYLPWGIYSHPVRHYEEYLRDKSGGPDGEKYYSREFVRTEPTTAAPASKKGGDEDDDDAGIYVDDDSLLKSPTSPGLLLVDDAASRRAVEEAAPSNGRLSVAASTTKRRVRGDTRRTKRGGEDDDDDDDGRSSPAVRHVRGTSSTSSDVVVVASDVGPAIVAS